MNRQTLTGVALPDAPVRKEWSRDPQLSPTPRRHSWIEAKLVLDSLSQFRNEI
jgi:hypothetical protein